MFKYNKTIDNWSKEKIREHKNVWGHDIPPIFDSIQEKKVIPYLRNYLNDYLDKNGNIIIKKFNKLMGLTYKLSDFNFYINTTSVSLHNSSKMYISIGSGHSFDSYPTKIIHELSHIYFYKYLDNTKVFNSNTYKSLSSEEINEIKEIITVIINSEFKTLIIKSDLGYPNHYKIRNAVNKFWLKNRPNFDKLIKEVIKRYKKRW